MPLNLEVPEPLAEQLRQYCQRHALSETELIQQLVHDCLDRDQVSATPYQLWQQVYTPESSGQPDLGRRAKEHLKAKLP
jgi:ATP-dependent exoDNAse (exonuclease V) beta subunit